MAPSIRSALLNILDQIEKEQGKSDLFSEVLRETIARDGVPQGVDPESVDPVRLRGAAVTNIFLKAESYGISVDAELRRRVEKMFAA